MLGQGSPTTRNLVIGWGSLWPHWAVYCLVVGTSFAAAVSCGAPLATAYCLSQLLTPQRLTPQRLTPQGVPAQEVQAKDAPLKPSGDEVGLNRFSPFPLAIDTAGRPATGGLNAQNPADRLPLGDNESETSPRRLPVRLRFTWGGAKAKKWQGQFRIVTKDAAIHQGQQAMHWRDLTLLSIDSDAPGSVFVDELGSIQVKPTHALTYSSFQVDCVADVETSELEIQFFATEEPSAVFRQTLDLQQLVTQSWNTALDQQGNGLWIERPLEDRLRFDLNRPAAKAADIFRSGQAFNVSIHPNHLNLPKATQVKYHLRLMEVSSQPKQVWEDRGEVSSSELGELDTLGPYPMIAGPKVGVYQLQATLTYPKSQLNLFSGQVTISRNLQWVVLPSKLEVESKSVSEVRSLASQSSRVQEVFSIKPQQLSSNWQRVSEATRFGVLPRFSPFTRASETHYPSLGSSTLTFVDTPDGQLLELAPRQWRTIELPAIDAGLCWVEIEYAAVPDMRLAVTMVQADNWGRMPQLTNGWGIQNPSDFLQSESVETSEGSTLKSSRAMFWVNPKEGGSGAVSLVLQNTSEDRAAQISEIRVLSEWSSKVVGDEFQIEGIASIGGDEASNRSLPVAKVSAPGLQYRGNRSILQTEGTVKSRQVGVYLESPLLAAVFHARKSSLDPSLPAVNDWVTFLDAGQHLVDYLRANEFNTVWLPILSQGGSLFPSNAFQTTSRYENSVFQGNGQPTAQLDVLELLLSQLDDENLSMVPVLELSGNIDALERSPADNSMQSGLCRNNGRQLAVQESSEVSTLGFYNPLNPRVQNVIIDLVTSVVQRCRDHRSFGGLAIELGPESHLIFTSEDMPLDIVTVEHFLQHSQIAWPETELGALGTSTLEERADFVLQRHRLAWLDWRSSELANFYVKIQQAAREVAGDPDFQVSFVAEGWTNFEAIDPVIFPSLRTTSDWQANLLKLGLDPTRFGQDTAPQLLFQWPSSNNQTLAGSRKAYEFSHSESVWHALGSVKHLGSMVQQSVETLDLNQATKHLSSRDLGTQTVVAYRSPNDLTARWADSLWWNDCSSISLQSWALPRWGSSQQNDFAKAFSLLPDREFQTLFQDPSSPVVVRQYASDGKAIIYIVNAARWTVDSRLALEFANESAGRGADFVDLLSGKTLVLKSSAAQSSSPLNGGVANAAMLVVNLPPSSITVLEGVSISRVASVSVVDAVNTAENLRQVKDALFRKLRSAGQASALPGPQNSDFEEGSGGIQVPGWTFSSAVGQQIVTDASLSHSGGQSLHITNKAGVAWVRTMPLEFPSTGRLSVTAWLRPHPESETRRLRLSIDGETTAGQKYYRFAEIDLEVQSQAQGWQPVAVHFDDLPEDGLRQMRIGFDLMSSGEVWVDSVQCFDRWFDANDQKILSNRLGLAAYALENKQSAFSAYQTMDNYWLKFISQHVEDPARKVIHDASLLKSDDGNFNRSGRGVRRIFPFR